jgi:hypothetical protein
MEDDYVVVQDDTVDVVWQGSKDAAFDFARRMSELHKGIRFNVAKIRVVGTFYNNPNLAVGKVIEFPPRPPQVM